MATQHFKRILLLNLYREEKISLVCFLLPIKRDKNVWHLQPISSVWRPLAFLPVTLSVSVLLIPGIDMWNEIGSLRVCSLFFSVIICGFLFHFLIFSPPFQFWRLRAGFHSLLKIRSHYSRKYRGKKDFMILQE